MTHGVDNRAQGRKKSNFPASTTIKDDSFLDFVVDGTNFKISKDNFIAALGATGTIVQEGDSGGTPVLDPVGSVNKIRNLEDGPGVKSSISPQNGITLEHNFTAGNGAGIPVLTDIAELSPLIRGIRGSSSISVAVNGDSIQLSTIIGGGSQTIRVSVLADLPDPVADAITLEDDTVYLFDAFVDIGANRLVYGSNSAIVGTSLNVACIASSNSDDLFTFNQDTGGVLNEICVVAPTATIFNLQSTTPTTALFNIHRVIIQSCASLGSITALNLFLVSEAAVEVMTGSGITFNGAFNFVNMDSTLIGDWTGTAVDLGTATFNVLNIENQNLISDNAANVPFDGLPNSGNINTGGHATVRGSSVLGAFTASTNILPSDILWEFSSNVPFPNSINASRLAMPSNATETVISVIDTPVLVAGTWTDVNSSRFTNTTGGRATYIGVTQFGFSANLSFSALKIGGGTAQYTFYLAKNGVVDTDSIIEVQLGTSPIPIALSTAQFDVVTDDFFELFVENNGGTDNCTVSSANIVIVAP